MSNIYKVNSLEDYKKQREKKEGLKNLFLERIDPKKSKEEIKQQLISALKKSGWKFGHGRFHDLPGGLLLADSYHCSRYNTNTGRLTREMFDAVIKAILAKRRGGP